MESKKLYGASTQMTPAVYKDFYKTYYNEKLKVFKIVAEIVGLIAIFGAFYILANGYGILWGAIALWIGAFLLFYPRMIYRKPSALPFRTFRKGQSSLCRFEQREKARARRFWAVCFPVLSSLSAQF